MLNPKTNNQRDQLKYRAYRFSLDVIGFSGSVKKDFVVQIILSQLIRCVTSIGANVIEAQASSSKRDFANFFSIALKSANETKYWLCLLRDSGKADREVVSVLLKEADEISKILGASLLTMRGKRRF